MILNKITHGFVIQSYDTKEQKWIGQDFVAGDDVEWEKEGGFLIAASEVPEDVLNNYLPFNMVQPEEAMTSEMYEKAIEKIIETLSTSADKANTDSIMGGTESFRDRAAGKCFAYNDAVWKIRNTIRLAKEGLLK